MIKEKAIILFIFFIAICLFCGCKEMKYKAGRDTVEAFGNGRFQISRADEKGHILYDVEMQRTIVRNVTKWTSSKKYVYVLDGDDSSFVVVNFETGEVEKINNTKEMSEEYKKIYRSLIGE